jgi:dTMP kinase
VEARGRGRFVTLEGPEGSGKTTIAGRLADAASEAGLDVVLTREPGGTALGEAIRDVLLGASDVAGMTARAEALLFNAARAELVETVIEPALARGALVVCARFADSTLAYQGFGRGLPLEALRSIERFATGGLVPDLTIVLDLPVPVGLARKGIEETTRFETLDATFHGRVRRGFLELARADPGRFAVVDAEREPDEVLAAVRALVAGRLGIPLRA